MFEWKRVFCRVEPSVSTRLRRTIGSPARANRELSFNETNIRTYKRETLLLSRNLLSFHPTELVDTLIKTLSLYQPVRV